MLGHWKDYDELEQSLSMPELTATLKAMYKAEERKNKFMAAIQGVDMNASEDTTSVEGEQPSTFEDVLARAAARVTGDENVAGALKNGITPDMQIGYEIVRSIVE